jgi:NADP-dependent 3-hydroxy acid dehydrogenase YdfG
MHSTHWHAQKYDDRHAKHSFSPQESPMKIENSVVLVTGANRGIGLAFARALLARGARKVYAAARKSESVTLPGVEALQLDVTKSDEPAACRRYQHRKMRIYRE